MHPTSSQREQWASRGLVPGKLTEAISDGVHVTFQQLLLPEVQPKPLEWWDAWWWCPNSGTAGRLYTVEPMSGGEFGTLVKKEVGRLQKRSTWRAGERVADGSAHGYNSHVEAPADTGSRCMYCDKTIAHCICPRFVANFQEPDIASAPPSPPIEEWERVTTTPEDHATRKERVKRTMRCRHCGNITGSLSKTCSRPACILKTSRGR